MPVRAEGSCPRCNAADQLLYFYEPTDPDEGLACPECIRARAPHVHRVQLCDVCSAPGAWRNPFTRRNEYLCGTHHAESGDGVVLNKWFPRVSSPHPKGRRPRCEVSDNHCRGEVKPRTLDGVHRLLCTRHAGKVSAAWDIEDGKL